MSVLNNVEDMVTNLKNELEKYSQIIVKKNKKIESLELELNN